MRSTVSVFYRVGFDAEAEFPLCQPGEMGLGKVRDQYGEVVAGVCVVLFVHRDLPVESSAGVLDAQADQLRRIADVIQRRAREARANERGLQ